MVLAKRDSERSRQGFGSDAHADVDGITAFLETELPPKARRESKYFAQGLLKAATRYDRYAANKGEWSNYARRRHRLEQIEEHAGLLVSELSDLDGLSRDDLATRVDPDRLDILVGSLITLFKEAERLADEVQRIGRRRDLAEERWIAEVADIYENAFGRPASVWGSGAGPVTRRGKFYHLLEVSRPASFPRHGKLSAKQIDRVLKRRKKPDGPVVI
jgi:hypothetical protein